jgi:translation initiation factor IF-1
MKTQNIVAEGKITACLADYRFAVELDNGHTLLAHLGGRLIKNFIRCTTGDRVIVEVSVYDLTRGRITRRY